MGKCKENQKPIPIRTVSAIGENEILGNLVLLYESFASGEMCEGSFNSGVIWLPLERKD
jgi:hypothetical protein